MTRYAALIFAMASGIVVLFQIAMAFGAPWGILAMGGQWPGQFPPELRIAALFQGSLIAFFAWAVLARAGLVSRRFVPVWAIWVVLAFSAMAVVANLATPSAAERALWAPVTIVMFLSCLGVALDKSKRGGAKP